MTHVWDICRLLSLFYQKNCFQGVGEGRGQLLWLLAGGEHYQKKKAACASAVSVQCTVLILSKDPYLTLSRKYMRFFGHTKKTIGNKYSEASCARNTANNYDNIGATKSTIMSVAKKHRHLQWTIRNFQAQSNFHRK